MPVYQYTCRDCGTPLEVHQEFSDAALTECPVCGGRLRKQYGSIGVTFNGSGFYRTDSRAGSADGGGTAESKDGAKSEPKGDGGSKPDSASSGSKSDSGSAPAKSAPAKPAASSASAG